MIAMMRWLKSRLRVWLGLPDFAKYQDSVERRFVEMEAHLLKQSKEMSELRQLRHGQATARQMTDWEMVQQAFAENPDNFKEMN